MQFWGKIRKGAGKPAAAYGGCVSLQLTCSREKGEGLLRQSFEKHGDFSSSCLENWTPRARLAMRGIITRHTAKSGPTRHVAPTAMRVSNCQTLIAEIFDHTCGALYSVEKAQHDGASLP